MLGHHIFDVDQFLAKFLFVLFSTTPVSLSLVFYHATATTMYNAPYICFCRFTVNASLYLCMLYALLKHPQFTFIPLITKFLKI